MNRLLLTFSPRTTIAGRTRCERRSASLVRRTPRAWIPALAGYACVVAACSEPAGAYPQPQTAASLSALSVPLFRSADARVPVIHPFLDESSTGASPVEAPSSLPLDAAAKAPTVRVGRVEPQELLAGDDLRLFVEGSSPIERPLRLEYRRSIHEAWEPFDHGPLVLSNIQQGALRVQLRAVDADGRISDTLTQSWQVAPAPDRPAVRLVEASPQEPFAGETLKVRLSGEGGQGRLNFEYRLSETAPWQAAAHGNIEIPELAIGELQLQVRAVDSAGIASRVVGQRWSIRSLCEVPLELRIAEMMPKEPVIGGHLDFQLASPRPSPHLVYQYRKAPDPTWLSAADGKLTVATPGAGEVVLQFRVADRACRDIATSDYVRLNVRADRFRVNGLQRGEERLIALIEDRQKGKVHSVGVSDLFEGYQVVGIILPQNQLVLRTPDGDYKRIEIPLQYIASVRNQPRTTARYSARRSSRERSERYVPATP